MKYWGSIELFPEVVDRVCDFLHSEDISQCRLVCRSWSIAFPYILTNAKFDREDILQDFIDVILRNPEVGKTFESVHLTYDFDLNMIAETAKLDVPVATSDERWKLKLIADLENVKKLPSLDTEQIKVLNKLVKDKMDIDTLECNKNRVVPSIFISTPEKAKHGKKAVLIFNHRKKKRRVLTLEDLALLHAAMPNLKYIKSQYLNLKTDGQDEAYAADANNKVESVDITLGNTVNSAARLVLFLLESYHKTIKSLKLAMMEDKCKWEHSEYDDNGRAMGEVFNRRSFHLFHLESLEINFFRYSLHIDTFLGALAQKMCRLKHVCFLGQVDAKSVFYHMTTFYGDSLESLVISIKEYEDVSCLSQLKKLKKFSLIWDTIEEKVDILRALMIMPQLTSLELGYDKRMGELVSNVVGYDRYKFLNHLSLSHVHIEGDEFLKLHDQLPNLKDVTLRSCKIGLSRTDKHATITFGSYNLNALVIEECRLFYAKRDKKPKRRAIARFMVDLMCNDPYRAKYFSSVRTKEDGKLYVEGDSFVYDFKTTNLEAPSDVNSLKIEANSLCTITSTKNVEEWVVFYPESEKDKYEPAEDSEQSEAEDEEIVSAEEDAVSAEDKSEEEEEAMSVEVEEDDASADEKSMEEDAVPVEVEEDDASADEKSMEVDAVPIEEEMVSAEEDLPPPEEETVEELVHDESQLTMIEVNPTDSEDEAEEVYVQQEEVVMEEIAEEAVAQDEYNPLLSDSEPFHDVVEEEQRDTEAADNAKNEEENDPASDDEVIEEKDAEKEAEDQEVAEDQKEAEEHEETEDHKGADDHEEPEELEVGEEQEDAEEQEEVESDAVKEAEEQAESESETEKIAEEQEEIEPEKPASDVYAEETQQEEHLESAAEEYYDEQYYNDTDKDMMDAEPKKKKKKIQTRVVIFCDTSDDEEEADHPVIVIKATPNPRPEKKQKKTIAIESDDDYEDDDLFSINDSSDSEYDDDMGTVRRADRKLKRAPKRNLRKTPKKNHSLVLKTLFSSSSEEEEDVEEEEEDVEEEEYDSYRDLIEGFMKNCKKYKVVIRIKDNEPPRKKTRYDSPSL